MSNQGTRGPVVVNRDQMLTPGARDYLREHRVEVVYPQGEAAGEGAPSAPAKYRTLFGAALNEKPEHMTHLKGNVLVFKDHPRIAFRGWIDALEAEILLTQQAAAGEGYGALAGQLYLHPNAVKKLKMDNKAVSHETLRSTNIFLSVYLLIFCGSILIVSLDNFDLVTNFTAVAATLNNIGPGLEVAGPMGNFSSFSYLSKSVMIFDMLAGRLEIFPLLLLFFKDTWKKF